MIRRLMHATTTAAAILAAAGLPATAFQKAKPAATPYTQPSIVDVYNYEGAYECSGTCAPDGEGSSNALMLASDGNYYGSTTSGGANLDGVIFKLTPQGVYTDIQNFNYTVSGASAYASLMEASDGNLYGVNPSGGSNFGGTIFQYNLTTGVFTTVYDFPFISGGSYSQLVDDGKGHLYGTTSYGGPNQLGNIFTWNYKTNTYTDIYDFTDGVDGQRPWAGIVIASDGRIYGTSRFGGPTDHTGTGNGDGVAWSINTDGTGFKAIHNFGASATDGYSPVQGFVEGPDGALYSTTIYGGKDCSTIGGNNGCGTLYKIVPSATTPTYAQIYEFNLSTNQGVEPQQGAPTLGGDGNLYIIGPQGGPTDYGQLMSFTTKGIYTDVHDFNATGATDTSGSPAAGVIEDQFGNLWGGTANGATNHDGEIYKIEAGIAAGVTLTASTPTADIDQSVSLTWNVTNAFSDSAKICFASSSDGSFTGLKGISGTQTIKPAKSDTQTYAFTCGGTQTAIATVAVATQVVTTTTLTSAPSNVAYGKSATFNVAVSSPSGKVSGNVELISAGAVLASGAVTNGVAQISLPTSKLASGVYPVQASYVGDAEYAASTSGTFTIQVSKITPSVTFSLSPNQVVIGVPLTLVVSVSNGVGVPSGTVNFTASGEVVASVPLASGSAITSVDTSKYPPGTFTVSANYEGDSVDLPASSTQKVTLTKDGTVTALSVASSVVSGTPLTATVTVTKPNLPGIATGSVQLLKNGKVLSVHALANGTAAFTIPTTGEAAGSYTLQAVYLGDSRSAASSSSNHTVTVSSK